MTATTYPTLEMDGKRYVLVPEDVYRNQAFTGRPVSKEIARRAEEVISGTATLISSDIVHRDLIGDDLKADRKQAGISQGKLAHLAGIRIETISRIEQKKTTARPDTLDKLYKVIDRFSSK